MHWMCQPKILYITMDSLLLYIVFSSTLIIFKNAIIYL